MRSFLAEVSQFFDLKNIYRMTYEENIPNQHRGKTEHSRIDWQPLANEPSLEY